MTSRFGRFGALWFAVVVALCCASCRSSSKAFLVYSKGSDIVSRTKDDYGVLNYATRQDLAVPQLTAEVSVAQFNHIVWAAWRVKANDATGSPQDIIKVTDTPASTRSPRAIHQGGAAESPVLVSLQERLHCFWTDGTRLRHKSTADGRTWTALKELEVPGSLRLMHLDVVVHQGVILLAAVLSDTPHRLFFGRINVDGSGVPAWGPTYVMSDAWSTAKNSVAITSDGSKAIMFFWAGPLLKMRESPDGVTGWGFPYTIMDYTPQVANAPTPPLGKLSTTFDRGSLHVVYWMGHRLWAPKRTPQGIWGAFTVLADESSFASDPFPDIVCIELIRSL